MKLIFDQNLAPRLVRDLCVHFPDSVHVRHLGLQAAEDVTIWSYALENGFTIVTKDDDFRQRSFLRGAPPKVVWVRLGNCTTAEVEVVLRTRLDDIVAFDHDPNAALLVLTRPGIQSE